MDTVLDFCISALFILLCIVCAIALIGGLVVIIIMLVKTLIMFIKE